MRFGLGGIVAEEIVIRADDVTEYVGQLAKYGAYGDTGVWRPAYSVAWLEAQHHVAGWCRDLGLTTRWDEVGNVWGRLEGFESGKVIVTGSHIDSQCPGGRFDGALGVIAGVLALKALSEQFGRPRRTIEVVSFCQEEASRFPTADMWGSRAVTGAIEPEDSDIILDYDGISIGAAMHSVGLDPAKVTEAARDDIDTFIELHIEQGPFLEHEDVPVGIVRGITGRRRFLVKLVGREDHAGACPMDVRHDPMAGAAEIILGVINTAHRMGRPAVTTVGRISANPNAPSIVPKDVRFTIDARHPLAEDGDLLYERHEALMNEVASRRNLDLEYVVGSSRSPRHSDPALVELLSDIMRQDGVHTPIMYSVGGHDAARMAQIAPMVMIFVRSQGGRSHTSEEYTTSEDAAVGIRALANSLYRLAY